MRIFGVLFVVIYFFVSVQSQTGFLENWAENFQQHMQKFGHQLSRDLENQGRVIEQEAKRYAQQVEREEKKRQEEFQKELDQIKETVKKIEAGSIPSEVKSANTTSLTENVNGQLLTIKTTVYSTGNENNGNIHTVQAVYAGETVKDWSINSIIWNGDQLRKKLVQYSPPSGNNNFSYNNNVVSSQYGNGPSVTITQNSGGVIRTTGGTSIISTNNGGGIIIQEMSL